MSLGLDTGLALIEKAREQKQDERFFAQWVVQLPYMSRDAFVPFNEYKDSITGVNIDTRPATEILKEIDEIESRFERKEVGA